VINDEFANTRYIGKASSEIPNVLNAKKLVNALNNPVM